MKMINNNKKVEEEMKILKTDKFNNTNYFKTLNSLKK